MPADDAPQNPYASPLAHDVPPYIGERRLGRASFVVGVEEQHLVTVEMSLLTGRERYLVDGVEQLRTWSWWGRRRFPCGEREMHTVEVHVAFYGVIRVSVDGRQIIDNLLPEYAALIGVTLAIGAVVVLGVLLAMVL